MGAIWNDTDFYNIAVVTADFHFVHAGKSLFYFRNKGAKLIKYLKIWSPEGANFIKLWGWEVFYLGAIRYDNQFGVNICTTLQL